MSRLGWIDAPRASLTQWDDLTRFADALVVLDSTDPAAVLAIERAGIGNTLSSSAASPGRRSRRSRSTTTSWPVRGRGSSSPSRTRAARSRRWAESSGKAGRGVVPVGDDPVSERRPDAEVVAEFSSDPLDLGAQFLTWEYATWELGERLGVNAFDQLDVEERRRWRAELAGGPDRPRPEDVSALATL